MTEGHIQAPIIKSDVDIRGDSRRIIRRISLFLVGFFVAFQAGIDSIPEGNSIMIGEMSERIPLKAWLSGVVGGLVGATSTEIKK